jgi:dUTP pyrophosphatase
MLSVKVYKIIPNVEIPKYQTEGASGFDLAAATTVTIPPGKCVQVPTGLAFAIPPGFELQIRPRGGFSFKNKAMIANTPGTVDADYRGEVFILMRNLDDKPLEIKQGQRIAQGVIIPVLQAHLVETKEWDVSETGRGDGSLGSTGE